MIQSQLFGCASRRGCVAIALCPHVWAVVGQPNRLAFSFISQTIDTKRGLLVGEGNGRFLAELMRPNPEAEIDCVDASAAMIQCARVRTALILRKARDRASVHKPFARAVGLCAPWHESSSQFDKLSRVKFHHADFLQWVPQQQPYDLVVTHFFRDRFDRDRLRM